MEYDLSRIDEIVNAVNYHFRDEFTEIEARYEGRRDSRHSRNLPAIGFCGHSRCGKDTAAEYLCYLTDMQYGGSNSSVVAKYIAWGLGADTDVVWQKRHQNAAYWRKWLDTFRGTDYSRVNRMLLSNGDVSVGTRGREELCTSRRKGVIDIAVWIDRPGIAIDPTLEYSAGDCDLSVVNGGTIEEFQAKLRNLVRFFRTGWFRKGK